MMTGPYVRLPDDLDLLRVPERAQLAFLRVALTLTEQALLGKHPLLRHAPFPSATEARTTALACSLLVRGAELCAMADAYERLLVDVGWQHQDDDHDDLPF
ncbi:MAG: hypothetical protein JW940_37420 [Polyangiaceae bacterium]|nr:hypothetical protein [Polyangiaceae bacterium]